MAEGVKTLEPPDSLHLQAAEGWLDLGNPKEAVEEFGKITESSRLNPDVLKFQVRFFIVVKNWETCLEVATALTALEPLPLRIYIYRSYALHNLKRTQEAYDLLYPAVLRCVFQ